MSRKNSLFSTGEQQNLPQIQEFSLTKRNNRLISPGRQQGKTMFRDVPAGVERSLYMTERELASLSSVDMTLLCSVGLTSQAHSDGRTAVWWNCPDRWNESLAIVPANDGDFQQHAENRWLTYWPEVTILGSLPWTGLPTSHTLAKKCHIFDRGVA